MFFTRNENTVIKQEEIKKAISGEDGRVLLHINITYPSFILKDKDKLKTNAQPFYEKSANNFLRFAEGELCERAKTLAKKENFRPLGAVMRYTNSFENKRFLSVYTDISVFDGENGQNQLRTSQFWNKDKGFILSFNDVFRPETREYLFSRFSAEGNSGVLPTEEYRKNLKRFFTDNNFYFTDKAVAFYYPANRLGAKQGVKVFYVAIYDLVEKKLIKISV
ncbi:MAG: hypothetical protein PHD46_03380 [Eubacteriales bacterium]|nr:hypothetical protein [Eubacteriales bacterium]MDD4422062.1 hypothetical protein [Eubacteriales bacterium]HBR32273.1 hypothetical protein [Clostridiales bacterium]